MLTAATASWVGTRLGKYHIIRELGRGGMGEVYLAEDSLLGREVAIKRLLPIFSEDEDFVSRFKREARAVSRLSHPGLVRVHSLDWINGVLLLDMEYVRGTSLLRVLQDSVVTPQLTARVANDVLRALDECHEKGIVHRDIKPSNILLDEALHAKLVDFGIATALADSTATQLREGRSTTVVLGTPRFMPPEAWDGAPVTPQWDLFALGVVLYECLTGEPAYKGTTTSALAKQITNEPLPKISSRSSTASAQLASVIDNLVAIDPAKRLSSARDALNALAGAPELEGISEGTTIRRSVTKTAARVVRAARARRMRVGTTSVIWRRWTLGGGLGLFAFAAATFLATKLDVWANRVSPANVGEEHTATLINTNADRFFLAKSLDASLDEEWHWWIAPAKGTRHEVVGHSGRGLFRATMTEDTSGVQLSGEWAGYSSPLGRGFGTGPLTGNGRWQGGNRALALQLKFENVNEHTVREQGFLAEAEPGVPTREAYLRDLEEAEFVPALIYNEMSARGLALGETFDAFLPASGQRVIAPLVNEDNAPRVDGVLDDPTWLKPAYDASGRIGEISAPTGARAMFRRTSKGLYIALRVGAASPDALRATLGVMAGITHPPGLAPRALLDFAGKVVSNRTFFDGDREVPFPSDWAIASNSDPTSWTAELFIPGESISAPWRFNFDAQRDAKHASNSALARWGDPDPKKLAHGVLIVFGQPAR